MGFTVTFPYINVPCFFLSVLSPIVTVKGDNNTIHEREESLPLYRTWSYRPISTPYSKCKNKQPRPVSIVIIALSTEFWAQFS